MIRKIPYCVVLLLLVALNVRSQTSATASLQPKLNFIPNSPEAAALGKFGDIPVALYTGIPDISVPIHNIQLKGMNIPISLSYHAGGIKVNELSSNVGLGWAMNAGGVITSTINGISDLIPTGWLYTASRTPQSGEIQTEFAPSFNEEWTTKDDYWLLFESNTGQIDTQPDIFTISLPGRSIKFFFDQNGQPLTIPAEKIKIEYLGYNIGFKVIDENDIVYEFKSVDIAVTHNDASLNPSTSNDNASYFLTKIITTDNEVVNFNYSVDGQYISENQPSETRYFSLSGTYNDCQLLDPIVSTSRTYFQTRYLSSITSSKGDSVVFNYNFPRLDVPESKGLSQVLVYDQHYSQVLKNFTLGYDHFNAGGASSDRNNYRLKLVSVQEQGKNPYSFTYNNTMPNRISYSQDHWGYFNNAQNTTLLPLNIPEAFNTGANREVDSTAVKAGALMKMTYPTGGYSTFDYESNRYLGVINSSPVTATISAFSIDDETVRKPFTIPAGSTAFNAVYRLAANGYNDANSGVYTNCTARIVDANDNLVFNFSGNSASGGEQVNILPAGQYYLELITQGSYPNGSFKLSWTQVSDPSQNTSAEVLVGGLRIAKISNFTDEVNQAATVKSYQYLNSNGISSGKSTFIPRYTYSMTTHNVISQPVFDYDNYSECIYTVQNSSAPTGSVKGNDIFYNQVSVYDRDKIDNGYTSTKFTVPSGYSALPVSPFPAVFANDWFAGMPLESNEYKYNVGTGNYLPVKRVRNEYKTSFGNDNAGINERVVKGFKTSQTQQPLNTYSQSGIPTKGILGPEFSLQYFYLYSSWTYKTRSLETIFDPVDSTKTVVTEHLYHYDNPVHMQLSSEEISKSTGEKYNVLLRYPKDFNSGLSFNANPVVEKRVSIKSGSGERVVSDEINTYQDQPGYYPVAFYSYSNTASVPVGSIPLFTGGTIDSGFEKRLEYFYGGDKNITSAVVSGIQKTGYKWSGPDHLLLAEIKNAEEAECFSENFERSGVSGNAHSGSKHSGGAYNVNWTRPNIRQYLISYFYLIGDQWKYKVESYNANSMALSGGTAYDDIKIYPADAQMVAYTYGPLGQLVSQIDPKGLTVTYEYDEFQRLKNVRDQDNNIIRSNSYHYKN